MVSTDQAVKQYKNYESKCKKELKTLNNQNKMLLRSSKNSGSRRELKNINNIRPKASKKYGSSSSNSSSNNYDSYISSDSE